MIIFTDPVRDIALISYVPHLDIINPQLIHAQIHVILQSATQLLYWLQSDLSGQSENTLLETI